MDSLYLTIAILSVICVGLYFLGFLLTLGIVQLMKKRDYVTRMECIKSLAWPWNTARGFIEDLFND